MKIGLILSSNIKLNPYIEIFRKVLNEQNIEYDVISWDRESLGEKDGIVFQYSAPNTRNKLRKLVDYYRFSNFAQKVIKRNRYDKLIVFGAAIGVFMYDFLNKYYCRKFWFDYRDLTIEQQFMHRFKKLCDISSYISISSPGFRKAFPEEYDFILSHNFDIDEVKAAIKTEVLPQKTMKQICISTIGGIRDYAANVEVIESLKNNLEFKLRFIGKGPCSESLTNYVTENRIKNVEFKGFYQKKDEWLFYEQTDMVNIYYPRIKSHETALSNRFYKSMIFRKPMIVTNRSTQGYYIEKYELGLSLENCIGLSDQIKQYITSLDSIAFSDKCNLLLNEFVADYDNFYDKLLKFINDEHR